MAENKKEVNKETLGTANNTKKRRKKKTRRLEIILITQILVLLAIMGVLGVYLYGGYAAKIKELRREGTAYVRESTPETFRTSQTSVVYDINGKEISVVKGEKDSYYLAYSDIPEGVKAAIVSIEDKKFFKHRGVDFKAIMRAVVAMLKNQKVTQGGSTITQQLARTVFLSNEKSWERKVEEIFIAAELEKKYTKEDILEFYLNNIYFANGYYGIEAAARGYFSCGVADLSLSEQAMLCGVPNNPTIYDPVTNLDNAMARRDRILKQMENDGKIKESTYKEEKSKMIELKRPKRKKIDYVETYTYYCATRALMEAQGFEFRNTFYSDEDKKDYENLYEETYADCQRSLFTSGYRIYTSIDLKVQKKLQASIDQGLENFTETSDEGVYKMQSSGVCIDNATGKVLAIVGGRSQEHNGYTLNRAYQSFRQPGSSIKPLLVYAPLLERGYSPDSVVKDEKFEGGPSNSSGKYSGNITLRHAVEQSKNTIAWKLLDEMTPEVGLEYLKNMNFSKIDARDNVPAIALGGFTYGMSAVEMASGYAALENDGIYREPTCIISIKDSMGMTVCEPSAGEKQVYEQNAARMMTDIMTGVMTVGTAKGLDLGAMPSAGKTGTTNDHKDGWFCGYTRYYTTAVWVGCDLPVAIKELSGASYPGHIWQDFMKKIHEDLEPIEFMPYMNYNDVTHVPEEEPEEVIEPEEPEEEPEVPAEEPEENEPEAEPEEKPQDVPVDIPGEVEKPQEQPEPEPDVEIVPDDSGDDEEEDEPTDGDVIIEL